jgi:hypothetical protein
MSNKLEIDSNLRFSESEVDAIDPERKYLDAVRLPDGGYMGMLHAYHELHCIVSDTGIVSTGLTANKDGTRNIYACSYTQITTHRIWNSPRSKLRIGDGTQTTVWTRFVRGLCVALT